MSGLTHLDADGRAAMVDVSAKPETVREATARGQLRMRPATRELALAGAGRKGDVFAVAEIAGVMAAKRAADIIPLCHPLRLTKVQVRVSASEAGLAVEATVRCRGPTGVEMEALTAVAAACLTLYDMLKAAERGMVIDAVRVIAKSGGASGDWIAP